MDGRNDRRDPLDNDIHPGTHGVRMRVCTMCTRRCCLVTWHDIR